MCNFAHLQDGENCELYTEKMECTLCGHASGGVSANAIYLGHSENTPAVMDRFSLVSCHICPKCGERFTIYQEFCSSWCFSVSEAVEHRVQRTR
jgi:rRNA maturation protein Nop10